MWLLLNFYQGYQWSGKAQSKEPWMSSECCLDLLLRWRNFLDHDSGHGVESSISICSFLSHAATDINSHSDGSLSDSFAVSSNLSNFVNVAVCSSMIYMNMHQTINGERFATLYTVEGEKPTRATIETVGDSEVTIVLHFQGCVIGYFFKNAILQKKIKNVKFSYT